MEILKLSLVILSALCASSPVSASQPPSMRSSSVKAAASAYLSEPSNSFFADSSFLKPAASSPSSSSRNLLKSEIRRSSSQAVYPPPTKPIHLRVKYLTVEKIIDEAFKIWSPLVKPSIVPRILEIDKLITSPYIRFHESEETNSPKGTETEDVDEMSKQIKNSEQEEQLPTPISSQLPTPISSTEVTEIYSVLTSIANDINKVKKVYEEDLLLPTSINDRRKDIRSHKRGKSIPSKGIEKVKDGEIRNPTSDNPLKKSERGEKTENSEFSEKIEQSEQEKQWVLTPTSISATEVTEICDTLANEADLLLYVKKGFKEDQYLPTSINDHQITWKDSDYAIRLKYLTRNMAICEFKKKGVTATLLLGFSPGSRPHEYMVSRGVGIGLELEYVFIGIVRLGSSIIIPKSDSEDNKKKRGNAMPKHYLLKGESQNENEDASMESYSFIEMCSSEERPEKGKSPPKNINDNMVAEKKARKGRRTF